jgi:DNA-directed RNA polymerase subunit F
MHILAMTRMMLVQTDVFKIVDIIDRAIRIRWG